MKNKKYLIVLILKILESHTDKVNPLRQTEIAKIISGQYPCDRKTVGRNIKFLKTIGYPIVKTGRGFYMENKIFSVDEVEYILSALEGAESKEGINKTELIEKTKNKLNGLIRQNK